MFTRIGLAVSRHPVVVLAVWALLLTVMTGLAFQGLGAGGLFERLASAEATTPDTDSHVVYSMTRTDGEGGESITVVVSGVDVAGDPASAALSVGFPSLVREGRTRCDVPVGGRRLCGCQADRHDVALAGGADRRLDGAAQQLGAGDQVVGREGPDDRVIPEALAHDVCGQADRGH